MWCNINKTKSGCDTEEVDTASAVAAAFVVLFVYMSAFPFMAIQFISLQTKSTGA